MRNAFQQASRFPNTAATVALCTLHIFEVKSSLTSNLLSSLGEITKTCTNIFSGLNGVGIGAVLSLKARVSHRHMLPKS